MPARVAVQLHLRIPSDVSDAVIHRSGTVGLAEVEPDQLTAPPPLSRRGGGRGDPLGVGGVPPFEPATTNNRRRRTPRAVLGVVLQGQWSSNDSLRVLLTQNKRV
jgi:hypothetical protein